MNRLLVAVVFGCAVVPALAQQPVKPAKPGAKADPVPWVHSQAEAILKRASDPSSFKDAVRDAETLFDRVIAYAPDSPASIVEADYVARMLRQQEAAPEALRASTLKLLLEHEDLGRTLVFLVKPRDLMSGVDGVLVKLNEACPADVARLPALAAAVCVVHDQKVIARASMRYGERPDGSPPEKPRTIDPVEVFKYYVANESRMVFSPRTLPPELLVYMVSSTAETDELEWALARHAGDRNVGKRYGDIVYDTPALKFDKPKRIWSMPYTLANIRQVGGVCEEQAYYASNVGKAVGVPSVMITGRDSVVAHAWDGYLVSRGNGYAWILDEGCFGDYKKLKGSVVDPQTGETIAAQELTLLAETAAVPQKDREQAVAMADAARRIVAATAGSSQWHPEATGPFEGLPAPAAPAELAKAYMEKAVKAAPTSTAVWSSLASMASVLNTDARVKWSDALLHTCAVSPDFVQRMIGVMAAGMSDHGAQAQAWKWLAGHDQNRADLRAVALMNEGAALEAGGDKAGAYSCYEEVAERLINDAPEAMLALSKAEKLLKDSGKGEHAVDLYASAFRRVARPANATPAFFRESSFYQVGVRYATLLEASGRANDAKNVRSQLKQGEEKERG